jgi:hypothetical protein
MTMNSVQTLKVQLISSGTEYDFDTLGGREFLNESIFFAASGGTVRVFRQHSAIDDAIGSHACWLEANMRVPDGIPLRSSLLVPACTVNCVQTLKVRGSIRCST